MPDCSACPGSCCRGLYLAIDNKITPDEEKYLALHGVIIVKPGLLFYPAPCLWLKAGRCACYEQRPDICRNYTCEGDDFIRTRI